MLKAFVAGSLVLCVLAMTSPSIAADRYKIDYKHAWISFSIRHNPWANYLGMFHSITGVITMDKQDITQSSVEAEITAKSIDTSDRERDQGELQTAGFLNSVEFPTITFKSTKIEKTGDNTGLITGDLSMAGVTLPVVLQTTFNGEKIGLFKGEMTAGFSATGSLNTNDFGMTGVAPLDIGPIVNFTIEIEADKCGLSCA